jgi:hypothetical protein
MTGSKWMDHGPVELCMNAVRLQALHNVALYILQAFKFLKQSTLKHTNLFCSVFQNIPCSWTSQNPFFTFSLFLIGGMASNGGWRSLSCNWKTANFPLSAFRRQQEKSAGVLMKLLD